MKLPDIVQREIDQLGDRVTIEQGGRHKHILVDGRLAAIVPTSGGSDNCRALLNTRAQIRRAARATA